MTSLHLGPQDTLDVALKKTWVCGESLERGRRHLHDLLLEENFVLPAMTLVSLKATEFLPGKLEGTIGVQVISCLLPDFPPFLCSCFKMIWFCQENFPYLVEILIFRPLHH